MKIWLTGCLAIFLGGCAEFSGRNVNLSEEEDKILYAVGVEISSQVKVLKLDDKQLEVIASGFLDGASGSDLKVDMKEYGPKISRWGTDRLEAASVQQKEAGKKYLEDFSKQEGVETTVSGVLVKHSKEGDGDYPAGSDTVKIHYHGTLVDGTVFDSSKDRGAPAQFPLGGLIKCWGEGVQKIRVGGEATLVCPPDTAYGENGSPPVIPPNASLIFDIQLLEIITDEKNK